MRKLYDIFKVLKVQKRIVSAENYSRKYGISYFCHFHLNLFMVCLGFIRVCLIFHQVFVKRYMEVCRVHWSFLGTGYTLLLNSNKKLVKVCIFFATKVWDLNTNWCITYTGYLIAKSDK